MMKKCGIMICAAALLLSGCGGASTAESSSPAASQQQESAADAQPAENSAGGEAQEQAAPERAEAVVFDLDGYKLTLPDGYAIPDSATETVAAGNADPKVNFGLATRVGFTPEDEGLSADYGLQDIPNIMEKKTVKLLSCFMSVSGDKAERTVSDSKEVDFFGSKMLREQGILEAKDGDSVHQIKYTAYYGKLDIPVGYTGTPTMWFAFTEDGDADAAAALADSVFASAKEK